MPPDSDAPWSRRELASFDRQTRLRARVQRVAWQRELEALPADCPRIARGGGVSYVAASFDREAVSQSLVHLDRLLHFDAERGVLRVEAGIRVADVQRFAVPRGWYLRIAPGHAGASIGGCIAVDAHGKNPARDGCFRAQLGALRLFHPARGWIDAEHGSAQWRAAVGGFGLTGIVTEAELQLARAPAAVAIDPLPVDSLAQAAEVLRRHAGATLLYGWHDARPRHFGRGVIHAGEAIDDAAPPAPPSRQRLPATVSPWPLRAWHPASLAAANAVLSWRWRRVRRQSLVDALLPLDRAAPYFAAFGPRGLVEAQWLWPHQRFDVFAERLAALVRRMRPLIPLLSSKLFDGEAAGIAFDGRGIGLALHVAMDARGRDFLRAFDALALEHGGRPNPIKQSGLATETLAAALPQLPAWRDAVCAGDPRRLFRSELSRRLLD